MTIGDQPESSCCAKRWKSDGLGCLFGFLLFLGDDDGEAALPMLPGSVAPPPLPPFTAVTVERLVGAELAAAAPLPLGSMKGERRGGKRKGRKQNKQKVIEL